MIDGALEWLWIFAEAMLRTSRLVCVIAGAFVILDLFRGPAFRQDCPPERNVIAWAIVGLGAVLGGVVTLHATYLVGERTVSFEATTGRVLMWFFVGLGLVFRSVCRAANPKRIWLTAILMGMTGVVIAIIDTVWI